MFERTDRQARAACNLMGSALDGARDLLAPVYALFAEGFDTTDVMDAHTLLDDL